MEATGDEPLVASTSGGGGESETSSEFRSVGSKEETVRVSVTNTGGSGESKNTDDVKEDRVFKMENEEARFVGPSGGALENQPSVSVSSGNRTGKKNNSRNAKLDNNKVKTSADDYDSILSAFDEYAAKGKGEVVGYGYEIGDMVWGKVKSHPWWPGHLFNEALASPSVRRSKREGHVLVAFFGDSSYGWFDPAELIPFEDNFAEKSRQTSSKAFLKAVEEAIDELSRRCSLGLACRCRYEFNLWPSGVEGYFVVDVGDYEAGVYSLSQINKARDNFQPRQMLSFIQQLALTPTMDQHRTIPFMKNKATVLACRKALFEEFDETYAQAFGTAPMRPSRPTAPVAVDPSKASLSGRLVFAEDLGKEKTSLKSIKTKDKSDKYMFKRRDESTTAKIKKASSGQVESSNHPHLANGVGFSGSIGHSSTVDQAQQISESTVIEDQHRTTGDSATMINDIKPSDGSQKLVESGKKIPKVAKRLAGELSGAGDEEKKKKKKRKKERNSETHDVAVGNGGATSYDFPVTPLHDPIGIGDGSQPNNEKEIILSSPTSTVEGQKAELLMLLKDLHGLALNPFHGKDRCGPAIIRQVFWKYRSLVYKKSLVLSPPTENETIEKPAVKASEKPTVKAVKTSDRPDDPTKGGKKRPPSDHPPEDIKKKRKPDDSEDIKKKKKKKKLSDAEDIRTKKTDEVGLQVAERKIPSKSTESLRVETSAKAAPSFLRKTVKIEPTKGSAQSVRSVSPTMLVMKFRDGAALPSGAELRAKFARFGPLDHTATRIFWKSYTCRLVYTYRFDAEAALRFAAGSGNLFGNSGVRCFLKEVGSETAEADPPVKTQKEDTSAGARDSPTPKISGHPLQLQQSVQLKSCLKKPLGDEGGNGGGRGSRVKFVLNGEESSMSELPPPQINSGNRNIKIASFPEGASSSSTNSVDASSKNLPQLNPPRTISFPSSTSYYKQFPMNMPSSEHQVSRPSSVARPPTTPPAPPPFTQHMMMPIAPPPPPPPLPSPLPPLNDISQQMLSLLTRCSDVVNNLTEVLGYVPYHPL